MHLHRMPGLVQQLFPDCLWQMPATAPPTLYLTFDDGPIPEETPFVVEQLAKYGAKGTFFCVGDNLRRHPEVARLVLEQGHRLANHTYHHISGWSHSRAHYLQDVARCQELLRELQPEARPLLRPPYGRITPGLARELNRTHQIVMWDMLTCDYDREFAPEACLATAIRLSRPGSIVVFHDSLKASPNLRYVLPRYLAHFAERGYRFERL
ncbi:peptidoglycan/xylan/chitin deacetylase (PgdA/CDA1 family) [Hymenobacter luteus]|uniref:Peptidoglycan/xylan/chitin deacetylase (PgdA/CDA1 family) n=2 Tax=Hymenobacter TaxID=89966 RepID=A0A7W9T142_9BACT|nr:MULTISPECIES: polysaccharide deacetylase family protein [Hymenobacter]MBB4601199.1 peptidoglycan/xylan/chitin deacetylase (PgdA/CDA1 family) [Hymenobacter latericoloratus]MBB6058594.1 peptidoglycan/xylan/chitin deacetylase (PgdA/CDA1 family) [Hymenobacter luteus]